MKRWYLILLLLMLAVFLIFSSGCTANETRPAEDRPAPTEKVIELKFSDWGPQAIATGYYHEEAARMVEENSNGRIKITNYYTGSLVAFPDTFTGVASGTADISVYQIDVTQGVHALNRIFNLPFTTAAPHFTVMNDIYQELLETVPEFQQENEKLNTRWLAISALPGFHMSTTGKEVRVPADFRGVKLAVGGNPAEGVAIMNELGAAVVPSSPADGYTNLERGLTEGLFFHLPAKDAFNYLELLTYHALFGYGYNQGGFGYIINLDTWNSLSPEDQKIIQEAYQWACDELVKHNDQYEKNVLSQIKADGHVITELSPDEMELWYELAVPQVEKWIADTEAKGWPAQAIYDKFIQLVKAKR